MINKTIFFISLAVLLAIMSFTNSQISTLLLPLALAFLGLGLLSLSKKLEDQDKKSKAKALKVVGIVDLIISVFLIINNFA